MNAMENFKRQVSVITASHEHTLKEAVIESEKEIENHKKKFLELRKELYNIESKLIEAREAKRKAAEKLDEYQRTRIGEHSLADERVSQIEEFRQRMPVSMKAIENENPLPYRSITELDTLESWPNRT